MPDICMCDGLGCKKRTKCYRHTATPATFQSYGHFYRKGKTCSMFWKQEVKRDRKK